MKDTSQIHLLMCQETHIRNEGLVGFTISFNQVVNLSYYINSLTLSKGALRPT